MSEAIQDDTPLAASERVAAYLRSAILAGSIAPGERIRQEEIAERLGASRLPVREALRMLELEGLTELVVNKGARVPRLDTHELDIVYRMRERLEPLALAESRLWNATQHYRRTFMTRAGPQRRWVVNAEHTLILDAIRRRDLVDGERYLSGHIRRTRIELHHSLGGQANQGEGRSETSTGPAQRAAVPEPPR